MGVTDKTWKAVFLYLKDKKQRYLQALEEDCFLLNSQQARSQEVGNCLEFLHLQIQLWADVEKNVFFKNSFLCSIIVFCHIGFVFEKYLQ